MYNVSFFFGFFQDILIIKDFRSFSNLNFFKNNFIYFWLFHVFIAVWVFLQLQRVEATLQLLAGLLNAVASFSFCGVPAVGHTASVVVVLRLSCSLACGTFPDQGSYLCLLHWQDSLLLSHQGSPDRFEFFLKCFCSFLSYLKL